MMQTADKNDIRELYYSHYTEFEKTLNGQQQSQFHQLRRNAIDKFMQTGFPAITDEEWRFTNVAPILKHNFIPAVFAGKVDTSVETAAGFLVEGLNVSKLVFVNGLYSKELSTLLPQAEKIVVSSLKDMLKNDPGFAEKYIARYAGIENGFASLNTAFAADGAVITIPDGFVLEDPVHILYLNGSESEEILSQPRNFILMGKNSQAKIIESYHSVSDKAYLVNSVTEILLEEYAVLHYYKLQNESNKAFNITKTQVQQRRSSTFTAYTVTLGGELVRNDINAVFEDEWCECNLYGLYVTDGKRHVDNHTMIDHAVPNCHSNELYKGVLDDNSRGVFNGKVMVRKDAQKTQAYQSNKNLLLSRHARIDTKPQLEIFADDVKCSHGATIGQLDPDSMFYLQSRGIGRDMARSLLIKGFAGDVIDYVNIEPLKDLLNKQILERLHQISL